MILDLFLICLIVIFIVDLSGAMKNFKKPFSCSLCSTWWTGLIYLFCTRNFSIEGVAWVALFAFLAKPIADTVRVLVENYNTFLTKCIWK